MLRLAGLLCVASAGVPECDFYPMIEYWKAGDFSPNPLCSGTTDFLVENIYPGRTSRGLRELSKKLLARYNEGLPGLSYRKVTCDIVSRNADDFCLAMGEFSRNTHCLTEYDYESADVVLNWMNEERDFGWEQIPSGCRGKLVPGCMYVLSAELSVRQFRMTPEKIDSITARSEIPTYYMLYKAIDHLQRFAEYAFLRHRRRVDSASNDEKISGIHDMFQNSQVFDEIIPNWKSEMVFMLNEPRHRDKGTLRTPYGIMASKGQRLLFVFRSPLTTYDSRLALYNQLSYKYLFNFTGEIHDGSATIYQTLSGAIEYAVDAFYNNRELDTPVEVIFTAADLPSGGAAVLLADHVKSVLSTRLQAADASKVNAVIFGSSFIADKAYNEKLRSWVEVRNVVVEGDSTDTFPCELTYSCNEKILLPRTGITTGTVFDYAALPGRVTIRMAELAKLDRKWSKKSANLQLAAIKDCAYICYLAGNHCPNDVDNRCQQCLSFT